jgi:hypothetical protein
MFAVRRKSNTLQKQQGAYLLCWELDSRFCVPLLIILMYRKAILGWTGRGVGIAVGDMVEERCST